MVQFASGRPRKPVLDAKEKIFRCQPSLQLTPGNFPDAKAQLAVCVRNTRVHEAEREIRPRSPDPGFATVVGREPDFDRLRRVQRDDGMLRHFDGDRHDHHVRPVLRCRANQGDERAIESQNVIDESLRPPPNQSRVFGRHRIPARGAASPTAAPVLVRMARLRVTPRPSILNTSGSGLAVDGSSMETRKGPDFSLATSR